MIGPLIAAVTSVITWVLGLIADIAYGFSRLSYYAADIPGVGGTLASWFASIAGYLDDLYFDVRDFRSRLLDVFVAIDDWLKKLSDLWNDVYTWLVYRIDDAYSWAQDALDWIVDTGQDLYDEVYGWIMDKIDLAYTRARNAWDWIVDTGRDLWDDVYGWISDKLDDAYILATDAWDWIVANAAKLEDIPGLIRDEVLQIVGPVFNLVSFFFDDISLFFTDPADYFDKKLDQLGTPFAERLWGLVEKILERIW